MNYMTIYQSTIADGPGVRVSLYVSGCHFHCKGCHNPESWNFDAGQEFTDETLEQLMNYCNHDYIQGLSILGGEPLAEENRSIVANIVYEFTHRFHKKDLWIWTGYEYQDLLNEMKAKSTEPFKKGFYDLFNIISNTDVLVVGQFLIDQRDITSANLYRGSRNQRVIDIKKSREAGRTIYLEGIPNNS